MKSNTRAGHPAETVGQLRLEDELKTYIATNPEIKYYRIQCDFRLGIWLTELDEADQPIEMYERDLSRK